MYLIRGHAVFVADRANPGTPRNTAKRRRQTVHVEPHAARVAQQRLVLLDRQVADLTSQVGVWLSKHGVDGDVVAGDVAWGTVAYVGGYNAAIEPLQFAAGGEKDLEDAKLDLHL